MVNYGINFRWYPYVIVQWLRKTQILYDYIYSYLPRYYPADKILTKYLKLFLGYNL
jgi:hypothetical protein